MSNLYDVLGSMILKIKETEGAIPKKVSQLEQDVKVNWDAIEDKPNFSGGGGVSGPVSWNDLTDRPFGEEITLGDTLTWDGNTDGLVSVEDAAYLVSGIAPTLDEMPNGFEFVTNMGRGSSLSYERLVERYQLNGFIATEGVFICHSDNCESEGIVFPKAGIYFMSVGGEYVSSLTIPGYGKFGTETIKTLDPKYLPESVKLTVTTTEKFRVEYDGNPDDRESVVGDEYVYLKVSEDTPAPEEWIGGTITATASGSGNVATMEVTSDSINIIEDGLYEVANTFRVSYAGDALDGVWVIFPVDMYEATKNHTLVFEGLQETTVTKIDPKFIPDSVLMESEMGKIVDAVINALPSAEGGSF